MSSPGDSTPCLLDSEPEAEPEPRQRIRVSIVNEGADWSGFDRPELAIREAAAALAAHAGCAKATGAEAGVVLGDDAMLRRLNSTYRGKDVPTNVLSFPFQPPPGAGAEAADYLGDVVLAAGTIGREARERSLAPSAHLQHLVVHGLLHLLGYDHGTDREAEQMERLEAEILATLGIADPHAGDLA